MTEKEIVIRVRQRLGLPASAGPRILTLIAPGLEKLARQVANDLTKRDLLLTDRASVTATITSSNQDYYADLATAISTNGVMLDYLEYGTVYHAYSANTFASGDIDVGDDELPATSHGFPTGLKVRVSSSGSLGSPLSATTDYFVINVSANSIKLATSLANAQAGTAVDLAATGSGNITVTPFERETVQLVSREFRNPTHSPIGYIYGWKVGTKLLTNAATGVFSFTVPFVPTVSTLPAKLDQDLVDVIAELFQTHSEIDETTK